jgi:YD repeat-containing protein
LSGPAGAVSAGYDSQDRLTQAGLASFTYSPNGERQSKTLAGQTTSYHYDGLGNLTGASLPGGMLVDYVLDGGGRRVGKQVNGAPTQAFLYQDGLRPIAELDGANTVSAASSMPAAMSRST